MSDDVCTSVMLTVTLMMGSLTTELVQILVHNMIVLDRRVSLDIMSYLPTTPVLVLQLVGGHEALLSGNQ